MDKYSRPPQCVKSQLWQKPPCHCIILCIPYCTRVICIHHPTPENVRTRRSLLSPLRTNPLTSSIECTLHAPLPKRHPVLHLACLACPYALAPQNAPAECPNPPTYPFPLGLDQNKRKATPPASKPGGWEGILRPRKYRLS